MNRSRRVAALACALSVLPLAPAASPRIHDTRRSTGAAGAVADSALHTSLREALGSSGNLRALFGTGEQWAKSPLFGPLLARPAYAEPGVHLLGLPAPDGDSIVVVTLLPFPASRATRHEGYNVGRWPTRGLSASDPRYAVPAGFIPVTEENATTLVSKQFRLGDFLTHDQQAVWPKVLVLRPVLLDKLELIAEALELRGLPTRLHIMSGFRTPQYNEQGVGAKGGRASASRHMYGDAADVFVDADGDGKMDDLNGDGRVTVRDAQLLLSVAEEVEAEHPELVGGLSAYPANAAHGPFVHVDARGTRARW